MADDNEKIEELTEDSADKAAENTGNPVPVQEAEADVNSGAAEENSDENGSSEASDEKKDSGDNEEEGNILRDIYEIAESTIITVLVIVMIFTYFLHPVNVEGRSMNDTLQDQDRVVMCTVTPGYSYGDIVIVDNNKAYLLDEEGRVIPRDITNSGLNECLIKRVIAEPGQTLDIDDVNQLVIVDGKVLDEPYIKEPVMSNGNAFDFPITIPEGYYFVMGDNRNNSADSRVADIGLIRKDQIYGFAVARYSPIKDFKILIGSEKK